jgi:hypothetical protein
MARQWLNVYMDQTGNAGLRDQPWLAASDSCGDRSMPFDSAAEE